MLHSNIPASSIYSGITNDGLQYAYVDDNVYTLMTESQPNWNVVYTQDLGDINLSRFSFSNNLNFVVGSHPNETSPDGNNLAGAVRVFENTGTGLIQRGQTLYGAQELDKFGGELAISEDGNTLAVSDFKYNIKVYTYNNGNNLWEPKGEVLTFPDGSNSPDVFLSDDGNELLVFTYGQDNTSVAYNRLVRFTFNNNWSQIGSQIIFNSQFLGAVPDYENGLFASKDNFSYQTLVIKKFN